MSHHFHGNIDIEPVKSTPLAYDVTFTNCETGVQITMHIPKTGVYSDKNSKHSLKKPEVQHLADDIAQVLERDLDAPVIHKKACK